MNTNMNSDATLRAYTLRLSFIHKTSDTIANPEWVKAHHMELSEMMPETWTHMHNLNMLAIGFKLKLLGVDWRSNIELGICMGILAEHGGIFEHSKENKLLVRRVR